jgi:3',5'-cyclic AMP phosphodiesterase CpdA
MKLYAISDLHLHHAVNREALPAIPPHPDDWLILAGDIVHSEEQLHFALSILTARFQQLFWVPGNHDLWTSPKVPRHLRGEAQYYRLVAICREHGVCTPEDPYMRWPGAGQSCLICPLFLLYDYSFRPPHVAQDQAIAWAVESGVLCADEVFLHPQPYASKAAWCASRCAYTEKRLQEASHHGPLVLINHFPLREDLLRLRRIPRFSIWCGTHYTADWHTRFSVAVVVSGHLHMRDTAYRDGVRFEEVSLGYPCDWQQELGIAYYLREILPGPQLPSFPREA